MVERKWDAHESISFIFFVLLVSVIFMIFSNAVFCLSSKASAEAAAFYVDVGFVLAPLQFKFTTSVCMFRN